MTHPRMAFQGSKGFPGLPKPSRKLFLRPSKAFRSPPEPSKAFQSLPKAFLPRPSTIFQGLLERSKAFQALLKAFQNLPGSTAFQGLSRPSKALQGPMQPGITAETMKTTRHSSWGISAASRGRLGGRPGDPEQAGRGPEGPEPFPPVLGPCPFPALPLEIPQLLCLRVYSDGPTSYCAVSFCNKRQSRRLSTELSRRLPGRAFEKAF